MESENWLKKAAESDHPGANYSLGVKALNRLSPIGPAIKEPQYEPYLVRAAELGVPEAVQLLDDVREAESKISNTSDLSASEKRKLAFDQWWNSRILPLCGQKLLLFVIVAASAFGRLQPLG